MLIESYKFFQEKLSRISKVDNPLGFRSVLNAHQMKALHNVFVFNRKYDLSVTAGEETYVPV